jgi:hypothetical protein
MTNNTDKPADPWDDPREAFLSAAALGCCILSGIKIVHGFRQHLDRTNRPRLVSKTTVRLVPADQLHYDQECAREPA